MLISTRGLRWIGLGLCFGALCCAGGREQTSSRETRTELPDKELLLRAGILRAEDRRLVDDALLEAIANPDARIRALAVRALGRIAAPDTRTTIEGSAEDDDPSVRAEAIYALGLLGDSESLPLLVIAARDSDPGVRIVAADAIGMLHAPESSEALIELMGDSDRRVAAVACLAATRFTQADFAVTPLLRLIDERWEESGLPAMHALAWLSSRPLLLGPQAKIEARDLLIGMTKSPIPEARRLVALGLTAPNSEKEGKTITKLITDPVAAVRIQAVLALGYPGAPFETFMPNALADQDQRVALAAVQATGRMRGPNAVDFLAYLVVNDDRLWLRREAVVAMARVNPDRAAAVANGISKAEEPELRAAAATLLYDQTGASVQETVGRLLTDSDPLVRIAAIPAVALSESPLSKSLEEFLDDTDPGTLAAIADAAERRLAGSTPDPEDLADTLLVLQTVWASAVADPAAARAQIAVLDAVAAAGESDQDQVRALLEAGLQSGSHQVRLRAIVHMLDVFGEDHSDLAGAATERPVEDYVKILRWAQTPRAALVTVRRPGFIPDAFSLTLDTSSTPLTAWNFAQLAKNGFFDGLRIHRVVPNFVVQDGDPRGDGQGGPGYAIRDEIVPSVFGPGTLGMASVGKDTAGSQWFITLTMQPRLSGRYTPFGSVVQNLPGVAAQLLPEDQVVSVKIYEGDGSEEIPPPEEL